MPINKIDPVWAENADSGDIDAPEDEKIEVGYKEGEDAYIEWWNYNLNRIDNKFNELVVERVSPIYELTSNKKFDVATGLFEASWGVTSDTQNTISIGAGHEITDIAAFEDADDIPMLIVVNNTDKVFEVWNTRTRAKDHDMDAFTDDLPSGGTEVWECISICTDATYVYGLFQDSDASPMDYRVQAWLISDSSIRWTGSTTGLAVTRSDTVDSGPLSDKRDGKIFVSSTATLCIICGWNVISADSSAAVSIRDITDGTENTVGAGDAPIASSAQAIDGCSDGTNIFFTVVDASHSYICSATIADATAGCGGTDYSDPGGYQLTGAEGANICGCGPDLQVTAIDDTALTALDTVLRMSNSSEASTGYSARGQNAATTPRVGDKYCYKYCRGMCFDGLNLWILSQIDPASSDQMALLKIDVAKLILASTVDASAIMTDLVSGIFLMSPDQAICGASYLKYLNCTFDGRDIWVNVQPEASTTNSGVLMRLPLALLRH